MVVVTVVAIACAYMCLHVFLCVCLIHACGVLPLLHPSSHRRDIITSSTTLCDHIGAVTVCMRVCETVKVCVFVCVCAHACSNTHTGTHPLTCANTPSTQSHWHTLHHKWLRCMCAFEGEWPRARSKRGCWALLAMHSGLFIVDRSGCAHHASIKHVREGAPGGSLALGAGLSSTLPCGGWSV